MNLQEAWREDAKDSAQLNLLPEAEGAPKVNIKPGKNGAAPEQEVVASEAPAIQQGKHAVQHDKTSDLGTHVQTALGWQVLLCRCFRVHN